MSTATAEFQSWLNGKLRELQTDESVFGSYIVGILEGDEPHEEKAEALEGILGETGETNLEQLVALILNKWLQSQPKEEESPKKGLDIDVNAQLAKLLEQQKLLPVAKERNLTEEERRIKEQILAQYSQTEVSDDDDVGSDNDAGDKHTASNSASANIERNTNVQDVIALQKEKREQARLDSAAKKQKDKDDREKQKQQREEKKEKRKTVKNEKRR